MIDDLSIKALQSGWLGHLGPALVGKILKADKIVRYADGETIFAFAQKQSSLYGVVTGMARMSVTMNEQAPQFGHIAGPGFWFGETAVVIGKESIIEIVASGATSLFKIDRTTIDALAVGSPETWRGIAMLAVMNQGTAIGAADDLMIRKSRRRLAAVLLRLSSHRNAAAGVRPISKVPVTQTELWECACLSKSSKAALRAGFVRSGLIRTDYAAIAIVDPEGLTALLFECRTAAFAGSVDADTRVRDAPQRRSGAPWRNPDPDTRAAYRVGPHCQTAHRGQLQGIAALNVVPGPCPNEVRANYVKLIAHGRLGA